ncbi:HAD family hydrolase [Cellulomonas fimi]|uniref:HAD family hydrolase n=1 Tax=Cellulomonas fimi TaxID=1708 RepID=UPI00235928E0|nr:HAD family phosphatase [Cellulomonas fimi]
MRYAAALVDVDGVLVDTDEAVVALWADVCEHFGSSRPGVEARRHVIGCSVEHTSRHLLPDVDPRVVAARVAESEPSLPVVAVPGGADLVRGLAGAGVPVALVTGASSRRLTRVVDELGLRDSVAATVTWGEAAGKPDPAPYLLAAARLAVPADSCVVVEDSTHGVRSAVAAGARCLGLARGGPDAARALRDAGADETYPHLHDIAAALGVAATATRRETTTRGTT